MEYKCNVCIKEYSSYKSLWNHTKKYHTAKTAKDYILTVKQQDLTANNICKYCNKKFTRKNNMNVHINKSCKERKNEINKLKEELAIIKQESKETNITNNINKGVINNNNNNTTNIIKFGSEDIINILTKKQIAKILNSRYQAIEESIRTVHFNKSLPEYQNIKIKNLRSNMALVHDGENFNAQNQYNTVYELIDNHVYVITQLLEEAKISISEKTVEKLGELIAKLEDDYNKFIDESTNRKYKNYKDYKIDNVKTMIYNEGNKVKP
jgi:molybdopterin-biosynthesis enzyme MoeA-like protein